MTRTTHTIRRTLTAIALSAATALLVVPLAQARLDDYATGIGSEPRASKAMDHILDVSARDTVQAVPSAKLDLRGDYMFQQYFRDTAKANDHVLDVSARDAALVPVSNSIDHILDVSARDSRTTAAAASESTGGTDWGEIGVGIALALGGALLLVGLVAVGLEVKHSRHPLRSV